MKRNELLRRGTTWRNPKCILLSDGSPSEKVPCCMIPAAQHSGKGQTKETVKRSVVVRGYGGGEKRDESVGHIGFSGQ